MPEQGAHKVSAFIVRCALGAVGAAGALAVAAQAQAQNSAAFNDPPYQSQDYSAERASPPGAENFDSYVADPAESYVTEGEDAPAALEPPREIQRAPLRETPRAPLAALEPRWQQQWQQQGDPEPYCRAYFPAGPGRDRSGILCEQSDGALRLTQAPMVPMARNVYAAAPSQYCREYQQAVFSSGVEQTGYGKACWQRDGSWQIVSAPTLAAARPRDYAAAPDYTRDYAEPRPPAPTHTQRPAERRLKMPEFYFGNLFGWLRPRDER